MIAAGISMLISEGWEITANADENRNCDEIELVKGYARAALEVIALGDQTSSLSFIETLRFNLISALVRAGSTIQPPNSFNSQWVVASHPDFAGAIMHFYKVSSPIVHISAASITNDVLVHELMLMADSLQVDSQAWAEDGNPPAGTILTLRLSDDLWDRQ